MYDLLITNGSVIERGENKKVDIAITGESITDITDAGLIDKGLATKVIDATEMIVVPGAIDTHTHIEEEFFGVKTAENWTEAGRNAHFGGVTCVVNFVPPVRGQSMVDTVKNYIKWAEGISSIDFALHPIFIFDDPNAVCAELSTLKEMGVPTVKAFTQYDADNGYANDYALYKVMKALKEIGGVIGVHAENKNLSESIMQEFIDAGLTDASHYAQTKPPIIESEAIQRVCMLAEDTGCPTCIVHMTCKEGVDIIKEYQKRGVKIFGEACSQYLVLDESHYNTEDGYLEFISPPLRKKADQDRLWDGIKEGSINIYGSDHCPYSKTEKKSGYEKSGFVDVAYGGVGLLENVPILFYEGYIKGRISLERFIEVTSTNPAKMMGLYPKKGCLAVGSDADIAIWDPQKEMTLGANLYEGADWTAHEGRKIKGFPVTTIMRGQVVIENGERLASAGDGNFIPGFIDEEAFSTIH